MSRPSPLALSLLLGVAVAAAFFPALGAGFLNWDDNRYILQNVHVRRLSLETVGWAFSTFYTATWHPLTWLSHALDGTLYGLDPRGHHATSVALHLANTVLLFHVLRALTGATVRSALVAALFGLHPLRVESVAWVAERKDVLSTFWWLVAIAAYVRWVRAGGRLRCGLVLGAFTLGLLAKPMVITLPCVLLLLDYWPLARLDRRAVLEKLAFLPLVAAAATVTVIAQHAAGAMRMGATIAFADRIANALVAYVRYLGLAVWPARLSPFYAHPGLEGEPLAAWTVAAAAAFLVAVSALVLALGRRRPHLLVGWLWYLGTLVPVIGLVQVGGQAMADRYTYVPLIGIALAVVWEVGAWPLWQRPPARRAALALAAAVLVLLGARTWQQTWIWRDSWTFWRATLAVNPRVAVAHYAIAGLFLAEGRVDAAIRAYRRALDLRPDFADAHAEVGNLLVQQGRLGAAAAHFRKALAARPDGAARDHNDLGNVLQRQGNLAAARRHLERALVLRPGFVEAHSNLGIVLADQGRLEEAAGQFRAALRIRADFAPARSNLATVEAMLRERGRDGAATGGPEAGP